MVIQPGEYTKKKEKNTTGLHSLKEQMLWYVKEISNKLLKKRFCLIWGWTEARPRLPDSSFQFPSFLK